MVNFRFGNTSAEAIKVLRKIHVAKCINENYNTDGILADMYFLYTVIFW